VTRREREVVTAILAMPSGAWYRARGHGDRVVLANLYRKGVLERRAWRGAEGDPDAAHEYRWRLPRRISP